MHIFQEIYQFDALIYSIIPSIQSGWLNGFFLLLTRLASSLWLFVYSVIVALLLWKQARYRAIFFYAFAIFGGDAIMLIIKSVIHRTRPLHGLIEVSGYSFPSGHATTSAIFFWSLIYLFSGQIRDKKMRATFIGVNIFLALLVGFSRVYIGVHYTSDVLAGFLIGAFWILLVINLLK